MCSSDLHLLQIFHGPLLVILLGTFLLGFQMRQSDQKRSFSLPFGYLLSAAIFFQTLCFQIARAGEYLVPICGFILILIFEEWKKWWKGLSLCLSLLLVGQIFYLNFKVQEWVSTTGIDTKEETIRAIAAIPKEARGLKVFNCEWDRSPYLLYFRPDLKFVDILDPSFLYFADSAAFKGREEIRNGTSADIYGFVRKAFKADYVLCRDPNVTLHFRSDPGFQQIYPATQSPIQSGHVSTLFKVLDDPVPNYVQKLNVRDLGLMDEQKLTEVRPGPSDASSKELELDKTPFLNLGSLLWKERTSSDSVRIRCAFISPALEEQIGRAHV